MVQCICRNLPRSGTFLTVVMPLSLQARRSTIEKRVWISPIRQQIQELLSTAELVEMMGIIKVTMDTLRAQIPGRPRDNIPEISFGYWNPTRYTVTKLYALRGASWVRTYQIGTVFNPYRYNKICSLQIFKQTRKKTEKTYQEVSDSYQ